jgi:hypothetical protein
LRDAGTHILTLSALDKRQDHWQSLLFAAEKGRGLMMARIAMMQALNNGKATPSERFRAAPIKTKEQQTALMLH